MESLALKIVHGDDTARTGEASLSVPLWTYQVDIGPALLIFYQYCIGRCREERRERFDTSYGQLLADFPTVGERAIKRWIEDLREPLDDDQPHTKYLRLGLLRLNKAKLVGRFSIEPLPPAELGPRASPARPSPQRRLLESEADSETDTVPQTCAHKSAVESPQGCAHDPAVELAAVIEALRRHAGPDRWNDYFGPPTRWSIEADALTAHVPHVSYGMQFKRFFGPVIGPACRDAFPRGAVFRVVLQGTLGAAPGPASWGGGEDRPQGCAHNPAVLFSCRLSPKLTLTYLELNLEVQDQVSAAQIRARAASLAARFEPLPPSFFAWQWVQTAWALETRRLPAELLEETIAFCHTRRQPAWQFARSIRECFRRARLDWLDARQPQQKAELAARLAKAGLDWDMSWEGRHAF